MAIYFRIGPIGCYCYWLYLIYQKNFVQKIHYLSSIKNQKKFGFFCCAKCWVDLFWWLFCRIVPRNIRGRFRYFYNGCIYGDKSRSSRSCCYFLLPNFIHRGCNIHIIIHHEQNLASRCHILIPLNINRWWLIHPLSTLQIKKILA